MSAPPPQPSNNPPFPPPCSHLSSYLSSSPHTLLSLRRCLLPLPLLRGAHVLRDPHEVPTCPSCFPSLNSPLAPSPSPSPRLYACLTCAAVTCSAHAPSHPRDLPGHEIAVDVDRAELFCLPCSDQIYHPDLDAAVLLSLLHSSKTPSDPDGDPSTNMATTRNNNNKRRRVMEVDAISSNASSGIGESVPRGLRGMNNLGNTCFMSSVLQALMHTPPMRNYFLSDLHNRLACQQKSRTKKNVGSGGLRLCLGCDLDAMYSAVFSGDRAPYSPAKFLYSWWQHASNLASYEQQDAHEFFISILNGIHEKVEGDTCKSQTQSNGNCCIAHRVFSGILRSDVICTTCGFTSTTYDPCVDISLDLDSSHTFSKQAPSKPPNQSCRASTLMGCLERFTRPERLCSDQKFFCQHCQLRQDSLKQMSIRRLPLVTCFHIKRFEHSAIRKMSRKVDRYLQFPFSLNMSPYVSSSILRSRYGNRIFNTNDSDGVSELTDFELFAMITHSGKLEAGHYITYLRLNNQWYKCDDAWVVHVSESTVRASQVYMLFYVQKTLYYKASENVVSS